MILNLGMRSPATRRNGNGVPRSRCQSPAFADAARTLTNTSPSPRVGTGTSSRCSTSGWPYVSRTMAFILLLPRRRPRIVTCAMVILDRALARGEPAGNRRGCCGEVSTQQEPGESACGSHVIRQTPCRPPGGHTSVRDDVAVSGVLNAVASQRGNDNPCAPLESGNGRDHEQCHDG